MIAGGENVFARDADQTSELWQRGAFVVVGMTETQINRVALVMEFRPRIARLLDEFYDSVHLRFVFRAQTFETLGVIKQLSFCFLRYKIDNLGEDRLRGRKQIGVIAGASRVPIAEWFPLFAVASRTKHFALGC